MFFACDVVPRHSKWQAFADTNCRYIIATIGIQYVSVKYSILQYGMLLPLYYEVRVRLVVRIWLLAITIVNLFRIDKTV